MHNDAKATAIHNITLVIISELRRSLTFNSLSFVSTARRFQLVVDFALCVIIEEARKEMLVPSVDLPRSDTNCIY